MCEGLEGAIEVLERVVGELDPDSLSSEGAMAAVEAFALGERLCATGKALAARRVEDTEGYRDAGHRSAASWLAEVSGESTGQALSALETASQARHLPVVDRAMRQGALSRPQAKEVASAATADPEKESELVGGAGESSLRQLRSRCRRVRAVASSAAEENARYEAIRSSRYCRTWTDADGAFRLEARLTPDAGAAVSSVLQAYKNQIFDQARRAGRQEPAQAYMADALVAMAEGSPAGVVLAEAAGRASRHEAGDGSP
ncbi:MAG: hypothetical protein ACRD0H_29725, partial [Actinomycetes bacterium]